MLTCEQAVANTESFNGQPYEFAPNEPVLIAGKLNPASVQRGLGFRREQAVDLMSRFGASRGYVACDGQTMFVTLVISDL